MTALMKIHSKFIKIIMLYKNYSNNGLYFHATANLLINFLNTVAENMIGYSEA